MRLAKPIVVVILLLLASTIFPGQRNRKSITCKAGLFSTLKPLPELSYQCPADARDESDDRILKSPDRLQALKSVIAELRSMTDATWWNSPVSDLNACYVRGDAGPLSAEEREKLAGVEYQPRLLGTDQIRLVVLPDPCYQTSFNGANAFLLYRNGSKVTVTQVLDGYYSRLDNSVFLHLPRSQTQPMIEIETVNISGMQPESLRYYYVIDKATNKAVRPKGPHKGR